ncbi:MAG: molybdopterin-dependent oxidoreductase [Bryobacteraceae bacterium]
MPQLKHSVCALDCPDCCSLTVDVDENGRAVRLRGDSNHPVTRGFLCGKVAQYLERVYHPDRLLFPQRRVGAKGEGRFERISWDEALGEIAFRLAEISKQDGPEAILPYSYAGTMGLLNGSGMDRRFFHRLGASRLDRTICSAAGTAALAASQGVSLGTEPEQFSQAKLIIAWGANVLGTNVHLWPFIVEARRNGAKFFVIDPVQNRTGRLSDRHFAVNPGSDLALALGMIHVILREGWQDRDYIDRHTNGFHELCKLAQGYDPQRVSNLTGLTSNEIELLATEYAHSRPAAIRVNYGVQRSERGGAAIRAIAALPAITGSWKEPGGGLQLSTSGAFQFNKAALERPDLQWESPLGREARLVNMAQLGRALTALSDPPVKALVVYNSNPAAIAPRQALVVEGLRRADLFTVVLEQFQTDTADYADILLPVTTFLEHTDLYRAYGHYYVQLARPAIEARAEAKSNVEIFRLLSERMGFTEGCFSETDDDMIRHALNTQSKYLKGVTLERLDREHWIRLELNGSSQPFLPFENGGFRTPSGKFEFGAESLAYEPPVESRHGDQELAFRYPLEFIPAKNDDSMNSTFGNRHSVDLQTAFCEMNEEDAKLRGVGTGDAVRVYNDRGECFLEVRVTQTVRPGILRGRSVRWNKLSPGGLGVNSVTSDRLTDIGGGPTFFSCLVQVEKCTLPA